MYGSDGLPVVDPREQRARAHHLIERRAGLFERRLDDVQAAPACAAASPLPTVLPSSSGAVPDTAMVEPTRTAREMPTRGS
jgi:hypothetical protein